MKINAKHKEFEVNKFDENISVPSNGLRAIDLNLQEGEKIEIVFTMQVKEGLPIDVWFLNEDHYLLLVSGAQFLFFIDGSAQEVAYTRKIVTLTEHDLYKLVITNYYNNQTIEVNIIYEIRTYYAETGKTSSENLSIFIYLLFLTVIILVVLVIALFFKTRSYKQAKSKVPKNVSREKIKKQKLKKDNTHKIKQTKQKVTDEELPKKSEVLVPKKVEPEVSDKVTPSFCGYCGKPLSTPFCKNCGRKV
ncbi:MAG: hypothetical protein A7315_06750 [Candidatus Altiarchaeales archaeon WOR_SM1_79]|nr:MAG: hypothetical protein A7315_06750 [Candidatus Altiarchaeales archaeon WOR_SM1_79]